MLKIKKGDTVQVAKGKDTGKKGKVLEILTAKNKALVQGINLVKKHKRQTRQDQQGGIISMEAPISVANLMLFCSHCSRPARVGFKLEKDKAKTRFCKAC
ncbi:MAG: 50S ribosomal protein L24, partial [Candidatus Omnitrophica bacterium]|nr:50S ribosomal protein L24 [Candidatus Omnitrophota bacterium]